MKNIIYSIALTVLALSSNSSTAQNYASQNVNMIGHWYNPAQAPEPVYGIQYQSVWGWHDSINNREYGIIGASDGTFFIDVTNPAAPVMCDFVPAVHGDLIWHEIKTYQNYCYIVSDDGGGNSFIIADLSYLPDSVHVVRDDNTIFEQCHTIYVDGDKLWGGSVTGDNGQFFYSMACYDLSADPTTPTLIRSLNQDYPQINSVHDMFVRNDTVYASAGYQGLHIYTFTTTFQEIGVLTSYPEAGYNHSSFLTSDGNTLIFMDEVPAGRGIKSIDVSNMSNISVNQTFRSNQGNTPHNPYLIGNDILIAANYTDGVQIFNMSNPSAIYRSGYFDSDTLINYPNYTQPYHGCWAAYTDLPSGLLLISDMQNGLYVLDISSAMTSAPQPGSATLAANAYPNPFNGNFFISSSVTHVQPLTWTVYDATGRAVLTGNESLPSGAVILEIPAEGLPSGVYSVKMESDELNGSVKMVKE